MADSQSPGGVAKWRAPNTPLLPDWVRERFQEVPLSRSLAHSLSKSTIDELDADWFEDGTYLGDQTARQVYAIFQAALHDPSARSAFLSGTPYSQISEARELSALFAEGTLLPRYPGLPPLLQVIPAEIEAAELFLLPLLGSAVNALRELGVSETGPVGQNITSTQLIAVDGFGPKSLLETQCVLEARFGAPENLVPRNKNEDALLASFSFFLEQVRDSNEALANRREHVRTIAPGLSVPEVEGASVREVDCGKIARLIVANYPATRLGKSLPTLEDDDSPIEDWLFRPRERAAVQLAGALTWHDLGQHSPSSLLELGGVGRRTVEAIVEYSARRQSTGEWLDPRTAMFDQWQGPIRLHGIYPPSIRDPTTGFVYAVFREDELLWVGTAPEAERAESLGQRLQHHVNGARASDEMSMAIFDRDILQRLKRSELKAIASLQLYPETLVSEAMRGLSVRYLPVRDQNSLSAIRDEVIRRAMPTLQTC